MADETCFERVSDNNDFIRCDGPVVEGCLDVQRRPSCVKHAVIDRIAVRWEPASYSMCCTVCSGYNGEVICVRLGPHKTIRLCIDCASDLVALFSQEGLKQL